MQRKYNNGLNVISNINYLLVLFSTVHISSLFIIAGDILVNMGDLFVLLFLVSIFIPSLIIYWDLNQLNKQWEPYFGGGLWVIGSFLPFISPSVLITYLCRRHEVVSKNGRWAGWPILVSVSIGIMTIAFFSYTMFGVSASGENTLIGDAIILIMFAVTFLPGLAAYFDLKYLRSDEKINPSILFGLLWIPGLVVWIFQFVIFVLWLAWRFRISSMSGQRKVILSFVDRIGMTLHHSGDPDADETHNTSSTGVAEENFPSTGSSDNADQKATNKHLKELKANVKTAQKAEQKGEIEIAIESYDEALKKIEQIDEKKEDLTEVDNQYFSENIDTVRQNLNEISKMYDKQSELHETLKAAERSFQEAIAGYINEDQTLSRVRFRQARESYEEAIEITTDIEKDLFSRPVKITVEPDQEIPTTIVNGVSEIPKIETIDDLYTAEGPPWEPDIVEELVNEDMITDSTATRLTLLSWWHNGDYEFVENDDILQRKKQAEYGFDQIS